MKSQLKLSVIQSVLDRRELLHIAIASACVAACGDVSMSEDAGDSGVRADTGVRADEGQSPFDVPSGMDVPSTMDVPDRDMPTVVDRPDPRMDVPSTDSGSCAPAGFVRVGPVASFPMGMFTFRAASHYYVGHDARGLYALTSVCTHRGCDVNINGANGFLCPCHSASYDRNGAVTGGPAPLPLEHYALAVCNGDLYINTRMTVPANTRTSP
jgi:Rieske Fe-S protein